MLTCAENLGSSGNDIGILLITEGLLSVDLSRSWYLTMTAKGYCLDVEYNSNIYFTFYVQSKGVYFVSTTTSFSGSSISATEIKMTPSIVASFTVLYSRILSAGN